MITELDPATCGTCFGGSHSLNAGGALKSTGTLEDGTGLWLSPNTGATNSTGFTGLPGGYRYKFGYYASQGEYGFFWTASPANDTFAWFRMLNHAYRYAFRSNAYMQVGFSVRCIKD